MPIDYKNYPANWFTEVHPRILTRALNACEFCGVINRSHIVRMPAPLKGYCYVTGDEAYVMGRKVTRVCLTIAHLGVDKPDGEKGDKHDKHDVRDENLAALCQGCHLGFDLLDHIRHRKENRELKLGILSLGI